MGASVSPISDLFSSCTDAIQASTGEDVQEPKKPRRSQRISSLSQANPTTPLKEKDKSYLPSPQTHQESATTEEYKEPTASPDGRPSQIRQHTPLSSPSHVGLSSPPSDTQALSQLFVPPKALSYEVDDEEAEGVWGYLVPLDHVFGDTLVLRARSACPAPYPSNSFGKGGGDDRAKGQQGKAPRNYVHEEKDYEKTKRSLGFPAGGYLIGRHPECGRFPEHLLNSPILTKEKTAC